LCSGADQVESGPFHRGIMVQVTPDENDESVYVNACLAVVVEFVQDATMATTQVTGHGRDNIEMYSTRCSAEQTLQRLLALAFKKKPGLQVCAIAIRRQHHFGDAVEERATIIIDMIGELHDFSLATDGGAWASRNGQAEQRRLDKDVEDRRDLFLVGDMHDRQFAIVDNHKVAP
jgi:hypothetical protein